MNFLIINVLMYHKIVHNTYVTVISMSIKCPENLSLNQLSLSRYIGLIVMDPYPVIFLSFYSFIPSYRSGDL